MNTWLYPEHPSIAQLRRRILAATSISYIVVILDTSIINVALERIAEGLHAQISGLQWVVNAYTLAFASLLLTGGSLGDRWGARNVCLGGLALFTFASMLCGFAPNLVFLVGARMAQGLGAAMLAPCALKLLNHAYRHPGERACAIGIWVGCGGAALAAGPLIGGLLIDTLGWRSIFIANVPIGLFGIWLIRRVPDDHDRTPSRAFDTWGQVAAVFALAIPVGLLIESPVLGWHSLAIISGVVTCAAAWLALLFIEIRQPHPFLPLSLFRDRVFSAAIIVATTTTLNFFGLIFVFSLYFQQIRNYSVLETGLAFLPLTAVVAGSNGLSGRLAKQYGARPPVLTGLACATTGFLGLIPAVSAHNYWLIAAPMLAMGIGGGLITPAVTAALMANVERTRGGIAAGVLNTARQAGAALGVAAFGALLTSPLHFNTGMRCALAMAAVLSLLATAIWWRYTAGTDTAGM